VKRKAAVASGALVLAVMSFAPLGCHEYDEPPFNPRELGRGTRVAAQERIIREKAPIPTTMQSRRPSSRPSIRADAQGVTGPTEFVGEEPVVRMSLQEVMQRAVAHNSAVAVAGYEPAIDETRVIEADARFDPSFFATVGFQDEKVLSPSSSFVSINPFNPSGFQSFSVQSGIRQNLFSGGQAELSYRTQRIFRDEGFSENLGPNPYYLNELLLRVTQPLLRDFGSEINRARITIARNNQRISVLEFRRTLEEEISATEDAYWQLVQAVQEVRIQEELLGETIRTADILEARRRAGADVTRVQTSQAEAAVASREAVLVRARARVNDLSDELKRRMGDPAYPASSAVVILPAVDPLLDPIHFDPAEQFDTALRNRLELGQQQVRIDSAAIALDVAKNNILPQLNLVGQVAFQGAGEDLGEAFDENWEGREPSYSVQLEYEIPFGNRLARSVLRRAQLQRSQAIEGYIQQIKLIEQEVSTALREVDTSYNEIIKRREAVFRSKDSLRAIQQRREADEALTPTFVQLELDSQQTYANARAEEAQAIRSYNVGISRLERAKGTLLRYNNVVMQEAQLQRD
jgi:outer membrane protein